MWRWLLALILVITGIAVPYTVVSAFTTAEVTISAQGANNTGPVVETGNATAVLATTATLQGNITNDQGGADRRGFVWDTVSRGDPGNATAPADTAYANSWVESGAFANGTFSRGATGLSGSTQYWVRAAARAGGLWDYGNETTFTTLASAVCEAPGNFTVTITGANEVALSWVLGNNSVGVIIRMGVDAAPANYTDGFAVYNGAGTNTTYTVNTEQWLVFRAWGDCGGGSYSADYAEVILEGGMSEWYLGLIFLCLGLTALAWRGRFLLWNIAAAVSWIALFAFLATLPPAGIAAGSPAHVIILLVPATMVVAVMMWATGIQIRTQRKWNRGLDVGEVSFEEFRPFWKKDDDEEYSGVSKSRKKSSMERTEEYRDRVRGAYGQRRRKR